MNRRDFGGMVAATVASSTVAQASLPGEPQTREIQFPKFHNGRLPEVGMLLYPGMTLLDLLGPQTVLSTSMNIHLLWKSKELLTTDSGVVLKPDTTLAECPKDLDILFVGGGPGQVGIMNDPEIITFMADRGSRAKYVTSVCSGSLVLGAAGLLKGYKATSHWACRDALAMFGVTPVDARVVTDRNRITGGGVTAGIDFGLVVLAKMLGEDIAKTTQLAMEYDPQPPFNAGSPKGAGPEVTGKVLRWMEPSSLSMIKACEKASKAIR